MSIHHLNFHHLERAVVSPHLDLLSNHFKPGAWIFERRHVLWGLIEVSNFLVLLVLLFNNKIGLFIALNLVLSI